MCCCLLSTLIKIVLVVTNLIFVLAGAALVGVGVASLVHVSDILEIIPVNINAIPISIIVLGCIVFAISFCGCCGAIKGSRCLLFIYSLCMAGLAAIKIYLATEIFRGLVNIRDTVEGWVMDAFDLTYNEPFHLLEIAFRCCGTTGPASYNNGTLPTSCCPDLQQEATVCLLQDATPLGCVERLGSYFETFGDAIGAVLIVIIVFEVIAAAFGLFVCCYPGKASAKK